MPALAHIGVGLAAKKAAPRINIWLLILAAEAVEILFMIFWALGIEYPPTATSPGFAPYSHSIMSGVLLSLILGTLYFLVTNRKRQALFIGALVLSHTIMDVLASPMLGFYPTDTGKTLFFNDNMSIGLGLYRDPLIGQILEYSITGIGLILYIWAKVTNRKTKIK